MSSAAAAERPNIVLIMADDLGVESVGCYGAKSVATPNLDRLAAAGLRFRHAYSQPLCTNTRVELMTGRRATRDWIAFGLLPPGATTFGHLLSRDGYATSMTGKWQLFSYDPPDYPGAAARRSLGMPAIDAGFEHFTLFHAGQTEAKGSRYADPTLTHTDDQQSDADGRPLTRTRTFDGQYGPDIVTDAAIWFLQTKGVRKARAADSDRPFLLYMPLILPHWPMTPAPGTPAYADASRRHEADVRHFPGMVAALDRNVGRVVEAIAESGQAADTLVLFYSDNGSHLDVATLTDDGYRQGGKGLMTDAGTHVPLIAYWPGRIAPGQTDALVGPVDFLPTLLDVAGIERPADGPELDGVSFAPVLRGESDGERSSLVIDFEPRPGWDKDRFTHQTFARDQRWKLYADGRLYDLSTDPYESRPINGDTPEQAAARDRLAASLPK